MSEPVLSPDEIARYSRQSSTLYDRLRTVVVAHRISVDQVDPLVRDLVLEIAAHRVGGAPPFCPDLELIGDLERGQRAARERPL